MDMLTYLQDSSDDESESDKSSLPETAGAEKRIRPSTAIACENLRNKNKVRRRGRIQIISSSKAKDSEIFSRSTPHRRGHWAVHVKISVLTPSPVSIDDRLLQERKRDNVKTFRDLLERRGISGTLVEHEYLHLSLSKQFSLQVAQIEPFVRQLTNLVQHEHSTKLHMDSTSASELRSMCDSGSIDEIILLNEEKSRSFLCWKVQPSVTLRRLVTHVDHVMKSYKQPVFYKPAKFHVSIASFPGNLRDMLTSDFTYFGNVKEAGASEVATTAQHTSTASILNGSEEDDAEEEIEEDSSSSSSESTSAISFRVPINQLKCTVGTTREFAIPLRTNRTL